MIAPVPMLNVNKLEPCVVHLL